MFKIDPTYNSIDTGWLNISDNYQVFHFDEYPILYTGTNYLGNKIIGSLVCEDEEGEIHRHFHCFVSNKQYNDFIKQKISYKQLILSLQSIYVLDKSVIGRLIAVFHIPINLIPNEYFPSETSFCPNVENVLGAEYSISLLGGLADIHEALSNTVSSISLSANNLFNNIASAIRIYTFNQTVHQLASTEGSFKINFRINLKLSSHSLFPVSNTDKAVNEYFQRCLDYTINKLPNEIEKINNGDLIDTAYQTDIIPLLEEVYSLATFKFKDEYKIDFINSLSNSVKELKNISSQIGNGFNGIEILGVNSNNQKIEIAYMDKEYANNIANIMENSIAEDENTLQMDDDTYRNYKIQIYDLNRDTRRGSAYINNEDILEKPKIFIEGKADLSESIFTESLHLNKWIEVSAKTKKVNGKFKSIIILSA